MIHDSFDHVRPLFNSDIFPILSEDLLMNKPRTHSVQQHFSRALEKFIRIFCV